MRSRFKLCSVFVLVCAGSAALFGQGFSPGDAARRMTVADGFTVKLVAAEPLVRQPVCIEFDDRGRLWVVQYLQYPNPAGLKRAKVDRYSRTVYDRIPEPPPRGPKGADRITILLDPDRAGHITRTRDFVSDLNLATGIAFGHGGVFVLQTPYLLFYPDRDGDDVPDSAPEVLLSGFGMEDAHSVANSLTWGPDGWLYGCQGSTVTANIRGIEFQQGVWRYHPITHRFELFCEGGGNSWGLDFDVHGNLLYSTNVGGYCMLHGEQGAYYWKSFGKHGALHDPYAYGYFDHVPHRNFHGGHVTVGGIIYQGDAFPVQFRGKYIAADLLGHGVYWHNIEPWGSSFRSSHAGELLVANDTWFAPTDVTLGPDGAVYVADWYDKRTAHPDPDADWDRSNGRIYKIERQNGTQKPTVDLARMSSAELVKLLAHPNDWYVRKARRILADRRDPEVIFPLRTLIQESKVDHVALEALWALYVSGGFDERYALQLLAHRNPHIRRWTVRFLGDDEKVNGPSAERLTKMATSEADVSVRCQLACTAKRLPTEKARPIVKALLHRNEDIHDPHLPLLLWWAVERHAIAGISDLLKLCHDPAAWKLPLIHDVILPRLMRRYAAENSEAAYTACAGLLAAAPSPQDQTAMLAALNEGVQDHDGTVGTAGDLFKGYAIAERKQNAAEKSKRRLSPALEKELSRIWRDDTSDCTLIGLMARLGSGAAQRRALELATTPGGDPELREKLLQVLGEIDAPEAASRLLGLLGGSEPSRIQLAAVNALQHLDKQEIAGGLLDLYARAAGPFRTRISDVLLSRKPWALAFLQAVDTGRFSDKEIAVDQLRQISLHHDKQLNELVRKHWGNVAAGTPEEKLAEMRRLSNDLRAGAGEPVAGKQLFVKHCAICHRLFGEGNLVGPELTHGNRKDRDFLLTSIVDPSAVIRKEYLSYLVQTQDGRVLTGVIAEQSPSSITLLGAKNERTLIPRNKIDSIQETAVSLMPENLLKDLKPNEVRDLFTYLQSEAPPAGRR